MKGERFWNSSVTSIRAGPICRPTTKSSAILDSAGVGEIGQRCLLISSRGFTFGIGTTLAIFHAGGGLFSARQRFMIDGKGEARMSAYSLRSLLGISSGLAALQGFNFRSAEKTGLRNSKQRGFHLGGRNKLQPLTGTPEAQQTQH